MKKQWYYYIFADGTKLTKLNISERRRISAKRENLIKTGEGCSFPLPCMSLYPFVAYMHKEYLHPSIIFSRSITRTLGSSVC